MFKPNRIFSERNLQTGNNDWFFSTRAGTAGPYPTREYAEHMLTQYVQSCRKSGNDGGRGGAPDGQLTLVQHDADRNLLALEDEKRDYFWNR